MSNPSPQSSFNDLGLSPFANSAIQRLGFSEATPIQSASIPVALSGQDLIGLAQTGSGKTLAFGLPILDRLKEGQVALVLAPTRELACQIETVFQSIGMRTCLLIGGVPMPRQIRELKSRPQVIVATPGRLKDHLYRRTANLSRVAIAVLDEADRMFDMGFAPAIRSILDQVPDPHQTLMFSATMPPEIEELARERLVDPVRIQATPANEAAPLVEQFLLEVEHPDKADRASDLIVDAGGQALVFTRTRHGARKVAKWLRAMGHSAAEIHSDRTQNQRMDAIDGFRAGAYRVLVATDIAARGIDVKGISLVLNFDLPETADDYVHRIGRTGRAGAAGRSITLATPQQRGDVRTLERRLGSPLKRWDRQGPLRQAERIESNDAPMSEELADVIAERSHVRKPERPTQVRHVGHSGGGRPAAKGPYRRTDRPVDRPVYEAQPAYEAPVERSEDRGARYVRNDAPNQRPPQNPRFDARNDRPNDRSHDRNRSRGDFRNDRRNENWSDNRNQDRYQDRNQDRGYDRYSNRNEERNDGRPNNRYDRPYQRPNERSNSRPYQRNGDAPRNDNRCDRPAQRPYERSNDRPAQRPYERSNDRPYNRNQNERPSPGAYDRPYERPSGDGAPRRSEAPRKPKYSDRFHSGPGAKKSGKHGGSNWKPKSNGKFGGDRGTGGSWQSATRGDQSRTPYLKRENSESAPTGGAEQRPAGPPKRSFTPKKFKPKAKGRARWPKVNGKPMSPRA